MVYSDLVAVREPLISVLTPSLNHASFLRETIESVAQQSFRQFEHIVVDGGSSDGTVAILRDYPHLNWTSEPDRGVLDAYQKALSRARGKYVIQCCVSDGFHARRWFERCIEVMERDDRVSLVWGLPQYMSENGALMGVSYQDFLDDPPPQHQHFLPFWLATKFALPEGNYCVRSDIIKKHFPNDRSEEHFRIHCHLGFIYNYMVSGYCPHFIPEVANYGRIHADQRGQRLWAIERPAQLRYFRDVDVYRQNLFKGRTRHVFRDANSEICGALDNADLARAKREYLRHRVLRSRILRMAPYGIVARLAGRLRRWFGTRSQ